ncbi:fungal-specific transcription factor domain-containing protein [Poronia punctata]|nr:fungal-specific transcription factor domain-containing protein [Poronia punctata]
MPIPHHAAAANSHPPPPPPSSVGIPIPPRRVNSRTPSSSCSTSNMSSLSCPASISPRCSRAGRGWILDMMTNSPVVRRATQIKGSLETQLAVLQTSAASDSNEENGVFRLFSTRDGARVKQKPLVTLAWAHAALIYHFVVVLGWQPANAEIRHHVMQIIEGSACRITPPALLRTTIWPLSIAGCLAEAGPANQVCSILESLQPNSVSGTVTKALEMMKNVWSSSNSEEITSRDLASCFRIQGDMVLLV